MFAVPKDIQNIIHRYLYRYKLWEVNEEYKLIYTKNCDKLNMRFYSVHHSIYGFAPCVIVNYRDLSLEFHNNKIQKILDFFYNTDIHDKYYICSKTPLPDNYCHAKLYLDE